MPLPTARKGQAPGHRDEDACRQRFMQRFTHPAFDAKQTALDSWRPSVWQAYEEGLKPRAPRGRGRGRRPGSRVAGGILDQATSDDALDADLDVQEEVRNAHRAVAQAVRTLKAGHLSKPDERARAT